MGSIRNMTYLLNFADEAKIGTYTDPKTGEQLSISQDDLILTGYGFGGATAQAIGAVYKYNTYTFNPFTANAGLFFNPLSYLQFGEKVADLMDRLGLIALKDWMDVKRADARDFAADQLKKVMEDYGLDKKWGEVLDVLNDLYDIIDSLDTDLLKILRDANIAESEHVLNVSYNDFGWINGDYQSNLVSNTVVPLAQLVKHLVDSMMKAAELADSFLKFVNKGGEGADMVPRCFVWVKKNYFPGDWRFVRYARRGYFSDGPWAHPAMAS